MHDLLPNISAQLSAIQNSLVYFMPEVYLAILFLLVLITDVIFGRGSQKLCRIVACVGMLFVLFKDTGAGCFYFEPSIASIIWQYVAA